MTWMLYGAYGYTGVLLAEEATRRGHRPLLAGRNHAKLEKLAQRLNLDFLAFEIDAAESHLDAVELVFHCAGPYTLTAESMQQACLKKRVHYVDLTGEIPVFNRTFQQDQAARQQGILLLSGAGFDVIPTDCLIHHVVQQVPAATQVDVAILAGNDGRMNISPGTAKSALEIIAGGGLVRRDGQLHSIRLGSGARKIRFSCGEYWTLPAPVADLVTAYQATKIPNITTYFALSHPLIRILRVIGPPIRLLIAIKPLRRLLQRLIDQRMKTTATPKGRTYFWARAIDKQGNSAEAWLETLEAYQFTAVAGVRAIEKILASQPIGALSPVQALGKDFVLEIEGTSLKGEI